MDFSRLVKAARASKPPAGYSPVPGSKHGGYRKKVKGEFAYWYPGELGHTPAREAVVMGDHHGHEEVKKVLHDIRRTMANPKAVSKRVWESTKHTIHEFPEALGGLRKAARGEKMSKEEKMALISTSITLGSTGLAGALGGAPAAAGMFAYKFTMHVALLSLHRYASRTFVGDSGIDLAEKIVTYGGLFKAAPEMTKQDQEEAQKFIGELMVDMKAVLEELKPEDMIKLIKEKKQ